MAENVGSLYLQLGLNLSELETGFVTASQTVAANISRLNRESNLIRIRSEVEIAGLDETADAERILEIRQNALNQQLAIQRDRVRILNAEFQNLVRTQGENSVTAQRAALTLERQRLALANLERELQNLNGTTNESDSGFSGLSGILDKMPPQLQALAAGIGAVAAGAGVAGKSVQELLEDFRELKQQAYELNMSVGKTRDFLRTLRLGGGDIGDFEGYIRGITDAFVKGEYDDPEFIALRKYGAEITDATGRLKEFADIVDEVYQAWKKADAAGEGIEFLQLTGGESGIRDAIQFFKRYEEAIADTQKVMKSGIDSTQLHKLDRAMNLVEEQAGELKNALGDIFVPAAHSAAESFFEVLRDGTEILKENKDAIQSFGFIAKEIFKTVGEEINDAFSTLGKKISEANKMLEGKTGDSRVDNILGNMSWRYGNGNQAYGIDKMIAGQTKNVTKSFGTMQGVVDRAQRAQEEYNAELKKTAEALVETDKKLDRNPLNQYAVQRIQSFKDELADLRIELDFEDEIEKAKAQVGLWLDRELTQKNYLSEEEESAIRNLFDAKMEQIARQEEASMQEIKDRVQEHWQRAQDIQYEMTHSAFEKELRDIEIWKDEQLKKAEVAGEVASIIAESAAKESQAFEREVDRIKGKMQTLDDKIFEQEHSQYENDLRRLQQERIKLYEEGMPTEKIERYYQNEIKKLNQRASKDKEYRKPPMDNSMERGGNGIMVIGGDKIIDDGLAERREEIRLLVDENQIRAQMLQNLADKGLNAPTEIQAMQNLPDMQKYFSALPQGNYQQYDLSALNMLQEMKPPETTIQIETLVTPLNNIASIAENILSAMNNRQQPSLTLSPNMAINLGGAYVFDEKMKKTLVDDITDEVVTAIKEAVQTATSRANYSYGC